MSLQVLVRDKDGVRKRKQSRILYLMHVDWRWIKQRPHFMAEELARGGKVLVLYRVNPRRRHLPRNRSTVSRLWLVPIPRQGRLRWILDRVAQILWLGAVRAVFRPNLVWVTHPSMDYYLTGSLRALPTVYDCMDDVLLLGGYKGPSEPLMRVEERLVKRAQLVLCSSERLKALLTERYSISRGKLSVVKNAVDERFVHKFRKDRPELASTPDNGVRIGYVGTVGPWLDFPTIETVLEEFGVLSVHLFGPVTDDAGVPAHDRIHVWAPVEHEALVGILSSFDALLIPFGPSALTDTIDPVKLYEYMASGKESIVRYYPELDPFSPYVHFYRSIDELRVLITRLIAKDLPRKAVSAGEFLARNTWGMRVRQVTSALEASASRAR